MYPTPMTFSVGSSVGSFNILDIERAVVVASLRKLNVQGAIVLDTTLTVIEIIGGVLPKGLLGNSILDIFPLEHVETIRRRCLEADFAADEETYVDIVGSFRGKPIDLCVDFRKLREVPPKWSGSTIGFVINQPQELQSVS